MRLWWGIAWHRRRRWHFLRPARPPVPWTPPSWTLFPNKALSLSLFLSLCPAGAAHGGRVPPRRRAHAREPAVHGDPFCCGSSGGLPPRWCAPSRAMRVLLRPRGSMRAANFRRAESPEWNRTTCSLDSRSLSHAIPCAMPTDDGACTPCRCMLFADGSSESRQHNSFRSGCDQGERPCSRARRLADSQSVQKSTTEHVSHGLAGGLFWLLPRTPTSPPPSLRTSLTLARAPTRALSSSLPVSPSLATLPPSLPHPLPAYLATLNRAPQTLIPKPQTPDP